MKNDEAMEKNEVISIKGHNSTNNEGKVRVLTLCTLFDYAL